MMSLIKASFSNDVSNYQNVVFPLCQLVGICIHFDDVGNFTMQHSFLMKTTQKII